jgi:hypothetical protein
MTVEDRATYTSCSVAEVKTTLETLYPDGTLEMNVTEQGCLVYKPKAI